MLLAAYAAILVHAVYCYSVVGHWPSYSHPDPSELPSQAIGRVVRIFFLAAVLSIVFYPITLLLLRMFGRVKANGRKVLAWHTFAFLAGIAVWAIDVGFVHLINWELD